MHMHNFLFICLMSVSARNLKKSEEKFSLPYSMPTPLHHLDLEAFSL